MNLLVFTLLTVKRTMTVVDSDLYSWEKIIANKWVILDTNTIINLIKYNSVEYFLEKSKALNINLLTLQPVVLELYRTNSPIERIKRNQFLNFIEVLGITTDLKNKSEEIQKKMWIENYYPEPTDLYLASAIHKYSNNSKTLLATSNLDDFREPLFHRNGFITLSDNKSICTISLLSFNQES